MLASITILAQLSDSTSFDKRPKLGAPSVELNFDANGDTHWINRGRDIIYKLSTCQPGSDGSYAKYPSTQNSNPPLFCHIQVSFGI